MAEIIRTLQCKVEWDDPVEMNWLTSVSSITLPTDPILQIKVNFAFIDLFDSSDNPVENDDFGEGVHFNVSTAIFYHDEIESVNRHLGQTAKISFSWGFISDFGYDPYAYDPPWTYGRLNLKVTFITASPIKNLKVGSNQVQKIFLGSKEIEKMYQGSTCVWDLYPLGKLKAPSLGYWSSASVGGSGKLDITNPNNIPVVCYYSTTGSSGYFYEKGIIPANGKITYSQYKPTPQVVTYNLSFYFSQNGAKDSDKANKTVQL